MGLGAKALRRAVKRVKRGKGQRAVWAGLGRGNGRVLCISTRNTPAEGPRQHGRLWRSLPAKGAKPGTERREVQVTEKIWFGLTPPLRGELLDVPYCHLVFTLPHEINPLAHVHAHARWVYSTLMDCVASTLSEFAANPQWLGGAGAITLVLHTWTQDLRMHLHVHALMACGALAHDGS